MQGLNRFLFGGPNAPGMPPQGGPNQPAHPSMRGGLPEFMDMLRAQPSYVAHRPDLEKGDKVLLPSSILENILNRYGEMPQPMIFSVSATRTRQTYFVGVLEFVAPPTTVILPFWMFLEMGLTEGETVRLGMVDRLPKATFLKIQPHKTRFIELGDPTAILNKHLREFTVARKGQTITIQVLDEEFQINILEVKPENQYNAVHLINTDVNLEFAAPLDYIDPAVKKAQEKQKAGEKSKGPVGVRIDNKEIKESLMEVVQGDYDPRKRRIPGGIRKEWYEEKFQGDGFVIGRK